MKAFVRLCLLLLALLAYGQKTSRDSAQIIREGERIVTFKSDVKVEKSGEIFVTEQIKVVALGIRIKHGIFRSLPLERNINNKTIKNRFKIISVKKNGAPENYDTKQENGYENIYIGDKDGVLSRGIYDYEIRYSAEKQIGFFKDFDEFYWNANGNAWDFRADSVQATVTLPAETKILQNSCYTGAYGSSEANCSSEKLAGNIMRWSARDLAPGEGLTVAVGFEKGIVQAPPPPNALQKYGVPALCIAALLGLLVYFYTKWRRYGIDPPSPVVVPQYSPPGGLSPASLGYILDGGFSKDFVTASLVNLAVKGYLKITEMQSGAFQRMLGRQSFRLDKLKKADDTLPDEEKRLMSGLLGKGSIEISRSYQSRVKYAVLAFEKSLDSQHQKFLNEGSNAKFLILPLLFIAVCFLAGSGISALLGEEDAFLTGFFFLIFSFVALFIGMYLLRKLKPGFAFGCLVVLLLLFVYGSVVALYPGRAMDPGRFSFGVSIYFLCISEVCLAIFANLIRKPSEEKLRLLAEIEGFKMYMGAAENQLIRFHNPPEMTPQVFEALLPYAIVLGVDKVWGERFQNAMASAATPYQNQWYSSPAPFHYAFASALNHSLSKSVAAASTQPSSSSSGSGGGGFSGGGGGGGGGGGW